MAATCIETFAITLASLLSHGLIVGSTGAGKSSRFVYPAVHGLCQQIARGKPITIVIMDMKGEPWLFHAVRELVAGLNQQLPEERRIPFRWLNPTANKSSFAWNPLAQSFFYEQRRESRVQMLIRALGNDYGDVYGAKHFRAQGEWLLRNIFQRYQVQSYAHLIELIGHYRRKVEWLDKQLDEASREIQSSISQVGQVTCMNVCPEDVLFYPHADGPLPVGHYRKDVLEQQIDMVDLITRPQIVYLNLTTIVESTVGRAIPRGFLWQLLAVKKWLEHQSTNKVFLFLDETQWLASTSSNIDHVYTQAREAGLSIIATLQDMHQVENDRLAKILSKNSGLEVWFDAPPEWRRRDQPFSTYGSGFAYDEIQHDETLGIVYVANPTTTPSANPFGEPKLARLRYALSFDKYQQYKNAAWPSVEDNPGTLVAVAEEKITLAGSKTRYHSTLPSGNTQSLPSTDSLVERLKGAALLKTACVNDLLAPPDTLSTAAGQALVADVMDRAQQLIHKITHPSLQ